jgi:hypothetical protein
MVTSVKNPLLALADVEQARKPGGLNPERVNPLSPVLEASDRVAIGLWIRGAQPKLLALTRGATRAIDSTGDRQWGFNA